MNVLHLKHHLITSPLASTIIDLRQRAARFKNRNNPELALLREEDFLMRKWMASVLETDSVCVDVGAHIGSISQHFRSCAPKGRHILIEASPYKADWLRRAFPGCEVNQVAVSDSEGEVSFFENLEQSGYSSLRSREKRGRTKEIRIPCTTLDHLLSEVPRVDLIKIDVEGFELNVVKGGAQVIDRLRPAIVFEAGSVNDPDIDNQTYVDLIRLLREQMNYEIRPVFGRYFNMPPIGEDEFMAYRTYPFQAFNFIAQPKPEIET